MDYIIKLHEHETMNFKWDSQRPLVKRTFEETYVLQKELVIEELEEMLDVPRKRIKDPAKDLDWEIRKCLSEKEEKEFIERNNKLYDFWEKTKPQVEEWLVLYGDRKSTPFKHFTINLDDLSWCNHEWDTPDCEDKAYIDISFL